VQGLLRRKRHFAEEIAAQQALHVAVPIHALRPVVRDDDVQWGADLGGRRAVSMATCEAAANRACRCGLEHIPRWRRAPPALNSAALHSHASRCLAQHPAATPPHVVRLTSPSFM
jgi:hypothetical protein